MTKKASAVVIGAGIIGVSVAYNLAKLLPAPVVVVDMNSPGWASTSAALGGFRHQFSSRLNVQLSIESVAILEKFNQMFGIDPFIRFDGYLFVAETEASLRAFKENRLMQRSLGVPVETYSGDELQGMFPFYDFGDVLGGNICYRDGHALTSAVHQGYLSSALSLGVELMDNTTVTGFIVEHEAIRGVQTTRGSIVADKVIIAAGAYSGLLGKMAGVNIPVSPHPRKILFTKGVPKGLPSVFPLIVDVDSTFAFGREPQCVFFANNRWEVRGFDAEIPPEYDQELLAEAVKKIKGLGDVPLGYAVRGLYEVTPDGNPIVSKCGVDGLYCCCGFNGHGFMHAPAIGVLMAELVSGQKPHLDITEFRLERFSGKMNTEKLII